MSRLSKVAFLFAGLSLVSGLIVRYLLGEWVPFCWVGLGLFVFFVGFAFFFDRRFFGAFFAMRTTKHGMSMGVMIFLVVALLGIANFIAVRKYTTFDFSLSQVNTISEKSIQLLKALDDDLSIRLFYRKGEEGNEEKRRLFRDLVKKYQDYSDRVRLEFIEVNERPDLARDFGVDRGNGIVFLEYKGRRNRISKIDEQEMSNALVKVTREKRKTVYFTVGHGEPSLEDTKNAKGFNSLDLLLESNNYVVKTWALNQNPRVPSDADVLIVSGPTQDFQDFEIVAIEEYLKAGGSLFLALNPQQTEGLEKIATQIGLKFENNYIWGIVETKLGRGINQGPVMGAIFSQTNEITKVFAKDEVTLFMHPMSIARLPNPSPSLAIDDLVKTTTNVSAFPSLDIKGEGKSGIFTLVNSVTGSFPGAIVETDAKKVTKIFSAVVVGDSEFMNNQMLFKNLNRDLVLNSIAFLAKETDLISISPKEPQKTELILTQGKFALFLFGFVIPLPLILLGLSIGLWYRRRNA